MIAARIHVRTYAGTRTRSYSSLFQPCRFEVQKEEQRRRCYDCRLVLKDLRVDQAKPASVQKRLADQLAVLVFHFAMRIDGASSPRLRDALTLNARLKLAHHHAAHAKLLYTAKCSRCIEPRCEMYVDRLLRDR